MLGIRPDTLHENVISRISGRMGRISDRIVSTGILSDGISGILLSEEPGYPARPDILQNQYPVHPYTKSRAHRSAHPF